MLLFITAYMELLLQTSGSLPASTNPKLRCGRLSGHKHLGIFGLGEEGEKAKTTSPQKKASHIKKDKTTKTKHEANPQGQLLNNTWQKMSKCTVKLLYLKVTNILKWSKRIHIFFYIWTPTKLWSGLNIFTAEKHHSKKNCFPSYSLASTFILSHYRI